MPFAVPSAPSSRRRQACAASRAPLATLIGLLIGVLIGMPPANAGDEPFRAPQETPKPHVHAWVKQTRKEWVPPVKQVVQVGVDAKGKPILETRIVKPGYWRNVTSFTCGCGATRS